MACSNTVKHKNTSSLGKNFEPYIHITPFLKLTIVLYDTGMWQIQSTNMEGSFAVAEFGSMEVAVTTDDTIQSDDMKDTVVETSKKTTKKRLKKKRPLRNLDGAILKQRICETQKKIQLLLDKTEALQVKLRTHEEEATHRNA